MNPPSSFRWDLGFWIWALGVFTSCAPVPPVPAQTGPTDADRALGFYEQAQSLMEQQPPDIASAIQYYTLALQHDAAFTQAYFGRARALAARGDHDAAEGDYARAVETAGPDKAALYHLLRARYFHAERRQPERAEADYDAALEWEERRPDPYLVDVLLHRALLYLDTARPDRAVRDYQRVLSLNPDPETAEQVKEMMGVAQRAHASAAGTR